VLLRGSFSFDEAENRSTNPHHEVSRNDRSVHSNVLKFTFILRVSTSLRLSVMSMTNEKWEIMGNDKWKMGFRTVFRDPKKLLLTV
jgi:hypothetical protein